MTWTSLTSYLAVSQLSFVAAHAGCILLVGNSCICRRIQIPVLSSSPYRNIFPFSFLSFLPLKDLHFLFLHSRSLLCSDLRAVPESFKLLLLVPVINIMRSDGCWFSGVSVLFFWLRSLTALETLLLCLSLFLLIFSFCEWTERQRGDLLSFLQLHGSQICFSFRCYLGDSREA